jgi:hypothetical protein
MMSSLAAREVLAYSRYAASSLPPAGSTTPGPASCSTRSRARGHTALRQRNPRPWTHQHEQSALKARGRSRRHWPGTRRSTSLNLSHNNISRGRAVSSRMPWPGTRRSRAWIYPHSNIGAQDGARSLADALARNAHEPGSIAQQRSRGRAVMPWPFDFSLQCGWTSRRPTSGCTGQERSRAWIYRTTTLKRARGHALAGLSIFPFEAVGRLDVQL